MSRVAPYQQINWDWRASGNFILGGTGSALIACAMLAQALGSSDRLAALVGVALVGAGLLCVWAEIGKAFRALNVYLHPQTSWMTREAMVGPFLFAATLGAVATGWPLVALAGAVLGLAYLASQAMMVFGSKGIPAWREPRVVPLMILTGLSEGVAVAIVLAAATGRATTALEVALIVAVVGRALAWRAYRAALEAKGAPARSIQVLASIDRPFTLAGSWLPALLLLVALAALADRSSVAHLAVAAVAALAALAAGWMFKFVLITRAAYNQGLALPPLPLRGTGKNTAAVKPGWQAPPR